jgi:DNA-directed RNA polymerase specialized sigma subunit
VSILAVKPIREVSDEEYAQALRQYTPCLVKTAFRWHRSFGIDEARHLGAIALWRAMQSYDSERESRKGDRANFLTHLMNYLHWTYLEASKVEQRALSTMDVNPSCVTVLPEEIDDRFDAIKGHLNERQRKVVDLIREGRDVTSIMVETSLSRQRVHQIFSEIRIVHMNLSKIGRF